VSRSKHNQRFQFPLLISEKSNWTISWLFIQMVIFSETISFNIGCTWYSRTENSCSNQHVEAQISSNCSSSLLLPEYVHRFRKHVCLPNGSLESDGWNDAPETGVTVRTVRFCWANFPAPSDLLGYIQSPVLRVPKVFIDGEAKSECSSSRLSGSCVCVRCKHQQFVAT
jgi:hypothetical protein